MQDGRQIVGTVGATKYKHKKHKEQKTLKERNFKFRKSYAEVIRVMDDKQAGKFIKAVSDYVFDGTDKTSVAAVSRDASFARQRKNSQALQE